MDCSKSHKLFLSLSLGVVRETKKRASFHARSNSQTRGDAFWGSLPRQLLPYWKFLAGYWMLKSTGSC